MNQVIPQVRTITRYGTGSVILFNYAESPTEKDFRRRFRIDRLTSNVPFAVRFVLRNDNERIMFNYSQKQLL